MIPVFKNNAVVLINADKNQSLDSRLASVDFVRGIVMIIMALDHVRTYMHSEYWAYDALDLEETTIMIFFTRWIRHFCAPAFIFLSGVSIWLQSSKFNSTRKLALFLVTRGLFLLLLEITIIRFGVFFEWNYAFTALQIIWAIGICMILMAGIAFLPYKVIFSVGILILLGHNFFLKNLDFEKGHFLHGMWSMMYHPATIKFSGNRILVANPFLGWLGLMMIGYCAGQFIHRDVFSNK